MEHGPEFAVVAVVVIALVVGAVTRGVSQRTGAPYTIAMLVIGLLAGIALRHSHGDGAGATIAHLLAPGANISPNLIIFVFLPALVFESAFALDVYGFRKNVGAVLVLAVPALVLATWLTALAMVAITAGAWAWSMPAALVFGALISATDPVAVVAILRELGAPKRLGILIEGESLLNDGTAIVVFNVLIALLIGSVATLDPNAALIDFLRVVLGGIAVGLVLAMIVTAWLSRTFNDPAVEITLTLVLAYASMLIAEAGFHVSGVMALVTAGLWMGSRGRTRVSPEVAHFLHEFWGMLAYIANTLIFLLVGLVVAMQVDSAPLRDVLIVLAAYAAIMVIRFVVTFLSIPLMNRLGDDVTPAQATVMSWGGLRGAVSLALALVISQRSDIDAEVRSQILMVTAGVVLLTIVINGTTMGAVLRRFGLDQPPLGEQLALLSARAGVLRHAGHKIDEIARDRDLRTVSWGDVRDRLGERRDALTRAIDDLEKRLDGAPDAVRLAGYWHQVLSVERASYWRSLGHGTLSARSTQLLNREIDVQMDALAHGRLEPPATRLPDQRGVGALARWLGRIGLRVPALQFEDLTLVHDLSRAEAAAADAVLTFIDHLQGPTDEQRERMRGVYREYRRAGKERLEDLRTHLPEMTQAIETRLARRIQLNFEREGYEELVHDGTLSHEAAQPSMATVEQEMKELLLGATRLRLPETADLCRHAPLFADLSEVLLAEVAELTAEEVHRPGAVLFKEGEEGDSMFIVARGAVHVIKNIDGEEVVLDVLGGGDILGEMALLTGAHRNATVRAATTVTVGKIAAAPFRQLLDTHPELGQRVWRAVAQRELHNVVHRTPALRHMDRAERLAWIGHREPVAISAGQSEIAPSDGVVLVLAGSLQCEGQTLVPPALHAVRAGIGVLATADARVLFLPPYGAHSA